MSIAQVEITGTLQADGTLVLDEKPTLPPGKVRVIVQAAEQPVAPAEDWWEFMQRARKELEAINYPTLTEHEVTSLINELRGDDDRIEEIYRQIAEDRRRREQKGC